MSLLLKITLCAQWYDQTGTTAQSQYHMSVPCQTHNLNIGVIKWQSVHFHMKTELGKGKEIKERKIAAINFITPLSI